MPKLAPPQVTSAPAPTPPRSAPGAGGLSPADLVRRQADVFGPIERPGPATPVNEPPSGARPGGDAPGDATPGPVIELVGQDRPFAPAGRLDAAGRGIAAVRFGALAEGQVDIEERGGTVHIAAGQSIPLRHPLFAPAPASLRPRLHLRTDSAGKVEGEVGFGATARGKKQLAARIKAMPALLGLPGFDFPSAPTPINALKGGVLHLGLDGVGFRLGTFDGQLKLLAVNSKVAFDASANIRIPGLDEASLRFARDAEGQLTGSVKAGVSLSSAIKGAVELSWDGNAIQGSGEVGYESEKFGGTVELTVMEKQKALQRFGLAKKGTPPARAKARPPARPKKQSKPAAPPTYAVFGDGTLNFRFTDWLSGEASVAVGPTGHLAVTGRITPQKEIELFKEKTFRQPLPALEVRFPYGIPFLGNIFVFVNIGAEMLAKVGPGKLYGIEARGRYSTDPSALDDFSFKGSFNMSAFAGMGIKAEAGVGLQLLKHDVKAGAAVTAMAGIRAYADATPTIGYREKRAKDGKDKKGEFFIKGELEIAAQPALELGGEVFVELDSPWWSPAPDKRWSWPLFDKSWPLGGSIGLVAEVEHVLGSGTWPKLTFKPAKFDAGKFMSDLYGGRARGGGGKGKTRAARWKEKGGKGAAAPRASGGQSGGVESGGRTLTAAKPKVAKGVRPLPGKVDAGARLGGKTIGEHVEDAVARKGARLAAPGKPGAEARPAPPGKEAGKPVGPAAHRALVEQVSADLKATRVEKPTYARVRSAIERKARRWRSRARGRLRRPMALTVRLDSPARDRKDGDVDLLVRVAPNATEKSDRKSVFDVKTVRDEIRAAATRFWKDLQARKPDALEVDSRGRKNQVAYAQAAVVDTSTGKEIHRSATFTNFTVARPKKFEKSGRKGWRQNARVDPDLFVGEIAAVYADAPDVAYPARPDRSDEGAWKAYGEQQRRYKRTLQGRRGVNEADADFNPRRMLDPEVKRLLRGRLEQHNHEVALLERVEHWPSELGGLKVRRMRAEALAGFVLDKFKDFPDLKRLRARVVKIARKRTPQRGLLEAKAADAIISAVKRHVESERDGPSIRVKKQREGIPGLHAEVRAVNDVAGWLRRQSKATTALEIHIFTFWLDGKLVKDEIQTFSACPSCTQILNGDLVIEKEDGTVVRGQMIIQTEVTRAFERLDKS